MTSPVRSPAAVPASGASGPDELRVVASPALPPLPGTSQPRSTSQGQPDRGPSPDKGSRSPHRQRTPHTSPVPSPRRAKRAISLPLPFIGPGSPSPGEQVKLARKRQLLANPTNPVTKSLLAETYGLEAFSSQPGSHAGAAGPMHGWDAHPPSNRQLPQRDHVLLSEQDNPLQAHAYSDHAMSSAGGELQHRRRPSTRATTGTVGTLHTYVSATTHARGGRDQARSSVHVPAPTLASTQRTSMQSLAEDGASTVASLAAVTSRLGRRRSTMVARRSMHARTFSRYSISTRQSRPSMMQDAGDSPLVAASSSEGSVALAPLITLRRRGIDNFKEYTSTARSLPPGVRQRFDSIIRAAHDLLLKYALKRVELDTNRVLQVAQTTARIGPSVTVACAHNSDEISELLSRPGQRFKGQGGTHEAACLLQRAWRRVLHSRKNAMDESETLAVSIISAVWATKAQRSLLARRTQSRQAQAIRYHTASLRRLAALSWRDVLFGARVDVTRPISPPLSPHVSLNASMHLNTASRPSSAFADPADRPTLLLHLPSVSLSQRCRTTWDSYLFIQHRHNMCVLDALHPNTHVVLIASTPWPQEYFQVYAQIMSDLTGRSVEEAMASFQVIPPAHAEFEPFLRLPLSKLLLYSPVTLHALKEMACSEHYGRCLVAPSLPDAADFIIAQEFRAIALGTDPQRARFLRSKTLLLRFLAEEKDPYPTHVVIEAGTKLPALCKAFARLIVENEGEHRWTFMADDSYELFGALVVDTTDAIAAMAYVRAQREHYQRLWKKGSRVQQSSIIRVGKELRTVLPKLYNAMPTAPKARASVPLEWTEFFAFLAEKGGVILVGDPYHLSPASGPHARAATANGSSPGHVVASRSHHAQHDEEKGAENSKEGEAPPPGEAPPQQQEHQHQENEEQQEQERQQQQWAQEDPSQRDKHGPTFVVADLLIDPSGSWSLLGAWQEMGAEDTRTGDVAKVFVSPPTGLAASMAKRVEAITAKIAGSLVKRRVVGHASIRFVVDGPGITVCYVIDRASDAYACARWLGACTSHGSKEDAGSSDNHSDNVDDEEQTGTAVPMPAPRGLSPASSPSSPSPLASSPSLADHALLPEPGTRQLSLIPDTVVVASNALHLIYAAPVNTAVLYQLLRAKGLQRLSAHRGSTLLPLDPKQHEYLAFVAYANSVEGAMEEATTLLRAVEAEVCPTHHNDTILSLLCRALYKGTRPVLSIETARDASFGD